MAINKFLLIFKHLMLTVSFCLLSTKNVQIISLVYK